MSSDPQRLFEASDADPQLQLDLQRARQSDPAEYDVAAGLVAFEAAITGVPEGEIGATAGTSKIATWIVAAVVGAAAAGAVAWAVSRDDGERDTVLGDARAIAEPHREPDPARAPDPAREPDPAPARELEPEAEPEPEAEREPEPESEPDAEATRQAAPTPAPTRSLGDAAAKARSRSPAEPARPEPTPDRLAAEMKATNAAKHALDADPAQALRLARRADRDFPGGLFGEERRAITVLALFRLGRTDDARAKAEAYLARHPRGSFADRIREALHASER